MLIFLFLWPEISYELICQRQVPFVSFFHLCCLCLSFYCGNFPTYIPIYLQPGNESCSEEKVGHNQRFESIMCQDMACLGLWHNEKSTFLFLYQQYWVNYNPVTNKTICVCPLWPQNSSIHAVSKLCAALDLEIYFISPYKNTVIVFELLQYLHFSSVKYLAN